MKEYWTSNVKGAKVDEAMRMRDDIEKDFAEIRDEFMTKQAIYADKIDLVNWRIARKAKTSEPNMMAHRVLSYIHDHCDSDLGSDAEEEPEEKSDEEVGVLGSDDE